MNGESTEKAEERASLLRQGAGNYANLCGVLAGFVMVIVALFVTPLLTETFPPTGKIILFELGVTLLSIASFGYILVALSFIDISSTPLWHYKSIEKMKKEYAFNQALVTLFTSSFLGAVAVLTFSVGSFLMALATAVGCAATTSYLVKDWWALAKRPPPKKTR